MRKSAGDNVTSPIITSSGSNAMGRSLPAPVAGGVACMLPAALNSMISALCGTVAESCAICSISAGVSSTSISSITDTLYCEEAAAVGTGAGGSSAAANDAGEAAVADDDATAANDAREAAVADDDASAATRAAASPVEHGRQAVA